MGHEARAVRVIANLFLFVAALVFAGGTRPEAHRILPALDPHLTRNDVQDFLAIHVAERVLSALQVLSLAYLPGRITGA